MKKQSKLKINYGTLFSYILCLISFLILTWMLLSWMEILVHMNDSLTGSHYQYSDSNFIVWAIKTFSNK